MTLHGVAGRHSHRGVEAQQRLRNTETGQFIWHHTRHTCFQWVSGALGLVDRGGTFYTLSVHACHDVLTDRADGIKVHVEPGPNAVHASMAGDGGTEGTLHVLQVGQLHSGHVALQAHHTM